MLTASHNPKEYNGYKAYDADDGQFMAPFDEVVMNEVANIKVLMRLCIFHPKNALYFKGYHRYLFKIQ